MNKISSLNLAPKLVPIFLVFGFLPAIALFSVYAAGKRTIGRFGPNLEEFLTSARSV
jgi:hypothetical protein